MAQCNMEETLLDVGRMREQIQSQFAWALSIDAHHASVAPLLEWSASQIMFCFQVIARAFDLGANEVVRFEATVALGT